MLDLSLIATKIANARKERGFTQEELAVRLGVSYQAVSKWERGLSLPDIELLLDMSKILDLPLNNMLGGKESTQETGTCSKAAYALPQVDLLEKVIFEPVLITIGEDLFPIFSDEVFLQRITQLRELFLEEKGVLLLPIRIIDQIGLETNEMRISIFGRTRWEKQFDEINENTKAAIVTAIQETITAFLYQFVDRHMVKLRLDHLKSKFPFCVEGVIPERINLSKLKLILKELVLEGHSISDLHSIVETIDENLETTQDIQSLVKIVGKTLKALLQ